MKIGQGHPYAKGSVPPMVGIVPASFKILPPSYTEIWSGNWMTDGLMDSGQTETDKKGKTNMSLPVRGDIINSYHS